MEEIILSFDINNRNRIVNRQRVSQIGKDNVIIDMSNKQSVVEFIGLTTNYDGSFNVDKTRHYVKFDI